MSTVTETLWADATRAMQAGQPADAVCHLAELVSSDPGGRHARLSLAMALGSAGNASGALKILRLLADRLAHEGQLLAAMVVVRHGLASVDDPGLVQVLQRIHVKGARAKAGTLALPPPLRAGKAGAAASATAAGLLSLTVPDRLARAAEVGCSLPPAGPAAPPVPLPLFGELDADAFIEVVRRLAYRRVGAGTRILEEGKPGETILVIASGKATVSKGGTAVAQLGAAAVLGEMALITSAPRSATVTATEVVEYFELSRGDVRELAKRAPKVADELQAYCRGRLLQNLLRASPLFSRFDEPTRMSILAHFRTATFEAAETIVVQGSPSRGLHLVATGEVDVAIANAEGDLVRVATLGPGEVFGEISLLKNQPATAFVTARTTVGALVLPADAFGQVLAAHPGVRQYLETLTADRLKASRDALETSGMIDPDDLILL
jgi:CRP-like cAMP-binding protein